jgi:HlyD family secretion protein
VSTVRNSDISALRIDRSRRRSGRGPLFWLLLVVGLAALALVGMRVAAGFRKPPVVRVATVVDASGSVAGAGGGAVAPRGTEVLTANGYVVPRLKASVSSEVGGRLAALYVEEGDTAQAGAILGVLRNDDVKAQLAADEARLESARASRERAAAELEQARREFARQKDLLERQLASQSAYDDTESRLAVAEANVKTSDAAISEARAALQVTRENLEKTLIRAPFEGTVLRKEAEVGEIVSPVPATGGLTRGAIVTMADLKSSEMVVDVNEGYVTRVSEGQPAEVELDAYQGVRFPARVRQVVPTADRQKATVQVKVAFDTPDTRILPEMGGKVYFLAREPEPVADDAAGSTGGAASPGGAAAPAATLIPKAALREIGGRSTVFVVKDGRAKVRGVEVLGPSGDNLRIGAGLAAGEQVVVQGPADLEDNAKVSVEGVSS